MKFFFKIVIFQTTIFILFSGCSENVFSILDIDQDKKTIQKKQTPNIKKKQFEQTKIINRSVPSNQNVKKDKKNIIKNIKPYPFFVGMEYTELVKIMGNPDIIREEYPQEVVLYKNDICTIHFFLSKSKSLNSKKINFIFVESKNNKKNICLESFLNSNK